MADILRYRIPGQPVVQQTGHFELSVGALPQQGFFLSTFDKSKIYTFRPDESAIGQVHFLAQPPYVASKEEYVVGAETLINSFGPFAVEKAVYSRVKQAPFPIDQLDDLFDALCEEYPKTFCYLFSSRLFGTWIGATPETLLTTRKRSGFAMALAGTKRAGDPTEWGDKEIEEHEFVADFIEKVLEQVGVESVERGAMHTVSAGPVSHLKTDFSFDLTAKHPIDIAFQLHPTPAVCGVPRDAAMSMIASVEHNDRELYTGFVGVAVADKSDFYVNLRCAQIHENHLYLYLGGGYTLKSDPQDEWEETERKSLTIQNVLNQFI